MIASSFFPVRVVTRHAMKMLPPVDRAFVPCNWRQKLALWLGRKTGLIRPYTPEVPSTDVHVLDMPEEFEAGVKAAVYAFMAAQPLNPQHDLLILVGTKEWHAALQNTAYPCAWRMVVQGGLGCTFTGIPVRCVGYMRGWLVVRRCDIEPVATPGVIARLGGLYD